MANEYATNAQLKAYAVPKGETDAADDAEMTRILGAVSRWLDDKTGTNFYGASETHYFDVPQGRVIKFDEWLVSVTTLTNGDGTVLTTSDYLLLPYNSTPKYGVKLRDTSNYYWAASSTGSWESVITLAGVWGYAASAPADIVQATLEISKIIYRRRMGENTSGIAQVTAAGVVITPQDVPPFVWDVIAYYKKRV